MAAGSALWTKVGLAAALVVLADQLLYDHTPGASLGLFTAALTLGVALVHPALRRDRRGPGRWPSPGASPC